MPWQGRPMVQIPLDNLVGLEPMDEESLPPSPPPSPNVSDHWQETWFEFNSESDSELFSRFRTLRHRISATPPRPRPAPSVSSENAEEPEVQFLYEIIYID